MTNSERPTHVPPELRAPKIGRLPGREELTSKDGELLGYPRAFWHPCEKCGLVAASHGFGVSLLRGELGRWYCDDCRPDRPAAPPATMSEPGSCP